jgi:hypothetical protein
MFPDGRRTVARDISGTQKLDKCITGVILHDISFYCEICGKNIFDNGFMLYHIAFCGGHF